MLILPTQASFLSRHGTTAAEPARSAAPLPPAAPRCPPLAPSQRTGEKVVDVHCESKRGCTPLWAAACAGHAEIVRIFCERTDVDWTLPDENGITPHMIAAANHHEKVVQVLNRAALREGGTTITTSDTLATELGIKPTRAGTPKSRSRRMRSHLESPSIAGSIESPGGGGAEQTAASVGFRSVASLL